MSSAPDGSSPVPAEPASTRRARLSKQGYIGLGLLFTLAGLFLIAILFPTAPGVLTTVLPIAAVGLVALWMGGILLGIGSRS